LRVINKNGGYFIIKDLNLLPKTLLFFFRPFAIKRKNLTNAQIIKNILYELGPVFIKFGQTLSTRSDLIGEELAEELSKLQDRLPPLKNSYFHDIIKRNFGRNISEIFVEFNSHAIAAASIAEVFKAKTKEGKIVAVKILKPDVAEQFKRDIRFFRTIGEIIESRFEVSKRLKPLKVIDTFEELVKFELDLRFEAAAASKLRDNHKNDPEIYVPEIYWELTTSEILTMEWIDGIKIYEINELKQQGHNLKKIASNIAIMFFNEAYRDGYFHADLHSGNILVNKTGQIVLLDFGIMGWLDRKTKIFIAEILYGFLKRDYDHVAKVHFEAGYVPKKKSREAFAQACRAIGEPIIGVPANRISVGKLLAHLFKVSEDFDMEVQTQLLLLQKTMVMVEGLGIKLDPEVNLWRVAEPWIEDWAEKNLSWEARICDKAKDLFHNLSELVEIQKHKEGCLNDNSFHNINKSKNILIWWLISINLTSLGLLAYLLLK
jgi:ubiquinone biosynthesis protein